MPAQNTGDDLKKGDNASSVIREKNFHDLKLGTSTESPQLIVKKRLDK